MLLVGLGGLVAGSTSNQLVSKRRIVLAGLRGVPLVVGFLVVAVCTRKAKMLVEAWQAPHVRGEGDHVDQHMVMSTYRDCRTNP